VVGAVAAEVGAEDEAFGDEQVERPVDRRRVHLWQLGTDTLDDLVRAEMVLGLRRQRLPDQRTLAGQAAALCPPPPRADARLVDMSILLRHGSIMPRSDRTAARPPANQLQYEPGGGRRWRGGRRC